ncbi:MAG: hypothetical protein LBL09_04565 [Oscillospiraceae bacterium]|jgi:RNA polymerase sigma-70 factor (ECF subfamily)|nr:hypothetical protein [Oscillospiraceae bacterium]
MKKLPRGADSRIDRVIEGYSDMVYRLAFARTRKRRDADRIYQEVFLRYMEERPGFADSGREREWFLRAAASCSGDPPKPGKRQAAGAAGEGRSAVTGGGFDEGLAFGAALDSLPDSCRTALHLYCYEGLSTAEISNILEESESEVRMKLARARRRLAGRLRGGGLDR